MRVLLLGATGTIGRAVLHALIARGHEVVALARSETSAAKVAQLGATVVHGDIGMPERWISDVPDVDGAIQMACNFDSAMGETERRLLDGLLPRLVAGPRKVRFIYTGGCWLFGPTGNDVATEDSALSPLPAFAWMVPHLQRVLGSGDVDGIVIHPAMVHGGDGGVLRRFEQDIHERRPIRIVGSEAVRWPLVHCDDLAELYAVALERAASGSTYLGVATEGVPVGEIARAVAHRMGVASPVLEIMSEDAAARELGEWARGYACDQRLSGAKARREFGWAPRHLDPTRDPMELCA